MLDEQTYPPGKPRPAQSAADVRPRIYLDASLSMSGYVTGAVGRRTAFESFVDRLGDYLPGADIYKFGQGADQEMLSQANFDRNLHSRAFYNLTYNPNDALIRQFNSDEQIPLSVLVTDGVQSDYAGQGNHPVVEAILEWVGKGRTFGVLTLTSEFDGPFYTELQRGWIMNGNSRARVSVRARPFYAFVFSRSLHEFDELRSKIQRDFPGARAVVFAEDAVRCEVQMPADARVPYADSNPAEDRFFWQRFEGDLFGKESQSAELTYEVTCQIEGNYPVKELSLTTEADCYLWQGKEFDGAPVPPPAGFDCEVNSQGTARAEGGDKVEKEGDGDEAESGTGAKKKSVASPARKYYAVRVGMARDPRGRFTLYRIKINAAVRDLPDDLLLLSTDDDSDPANAGKTYRLTSLLTALASVHLKNYLAGAVSPTIYLTVRNS